MYLITMSIFFLSLNSSKNVVCSQLKAEIVGIGFTNHDFFVDIPAFE